MYRPMPIGSVLSWIAFIAFLLLSIRVSAWSVIPVVLFGIYAAMCTCLGISYARLIRTQTKALAATAVITGTSATRAPCSMRTRA